MDWGLLLVKDVYLDVTNETDQRLLWRRQATGQMVHILYNVNLLTITGHNHHRKLRQPGKNHLIQLINQKARTRREVEWQLNHNTTAVCVYICRAGGPGPDSHGNR